MENEVVVVDAEAGVEHFGRRVDGECDLILGVVDPSYESFMLAQKMEDMAQTAGCEIFYILNKINPEIEAAMAEHLDPKKIIAKIHQSDGIFMDSLKGNPLQADLAEIEPVCDLIKDRKKNPVIKPSLFPMNQL
jgi:CO dehydrogenase maturation factor